MAHKPTDEQQAAIDGYRTGENMVIEAAAGTGKTSTLRYIADVDPSRTGLYLAFNKAIAVEAGKKFAGTNVRASTAHALAYADFGRPMQHKLNRGRIRPQEFGERLGIRSSYLARSAGSQFGVSVQKRTIIRMVRETVTQFCRSVDHEILPKHVLVPPQLALNEAEADDLREFVVKYARRYWSDAIDPHGSLDYTHDFYMKQWAMTDPQIGVDYILFDEAQDADAIMSYVVSIQKDAQIIAVGDRSQAIYGWRGAVDSMDAFGGERFQLTQSFRFGHAIAQEANRWLELLDASLRVRGSDKPSSVHESIKAIPDAVLCRTNAGAMSEVIFSQELGVPVGIAGQGRAKQMRSLAEAADTLQTKHYTFHPDLDMFKSWEEVQEFVKEEEDSELAPLVRLVDRYGPKRLMKAIDDCVSVEDARTVVSTAHSAKGLEWRHVRVSDDFKVPKLDEEGNLEEIAPGELMLNYVTVTRAIRHLDNSGLEWVRGYQRALSRPELGMNWRRVFFDRQKDLRESRYRQANSFSAA